MRALALVLLVSVATNAGAITSADFLSRTSVPDGGSGFALPYRIYVPAACASRKCPLALFLHGAGETGSNNTAQLGNRANGAFALAEKAAAAGDPMILVAPQTPEWWANDGPAGGLGDLLDDVQREFGYDPARLYVSGLSMGGGGTLGFLSRFDAVAAAAAPICPAGQFTSTIDRDRFNVMPMWLFHAVNDGTVGVANSQNTAATLRAGGGDPIYTEYATGDHGIWTNSYNNTRLTDWLLAQRWRTRALGIDPRVTLSQPSDEATWYTGAASLSLAGTTSEASANVTRVDYTFGATTAQATGTTSFTAGPLDVPPNATTLLRATATGTSYVGAWGGNTTFSRTVRVVHPVPANKAPAVALWIEPVVTVGTPVRIRAMVADDGQPQPLPDVTLQQVEGPAPSTLDIDAANEGFAWWTPTQAGVYRFTATADDGPLATTTEAAVLVLAPGATRPTTAAVNLGGPAFTAPSTGVQFIAETGTSGGGVESLTTGVTTIHGTEDDALHRTMRRGNFTFSRALPSGRYLVVVYLSEWRWFTAVSRGMDLTIESLPALRNFDLYRWLGHRNAARFGYAVDVTDGTLNVQVARATGATTDPRVDAIEILALPPGDVVFKHGYENPP